MATRAKAGSKPDGAAWAATQRHRYPGCHTCRWGKVNPDGLRFIDAALKQKRAGAATFGLEALLAEVATTFGYALTVGALVNHYKRCGK